MALASFSFFANAADYMVVKTADGSEDVYEMKHVTEMYYEEVDDAATVQGVSVNGKVGEYAYVDLYLPSGTKWATFNVGASNPTGAGDLFAWGETKSKNDYSLASYKWFDASAEKYTKYGYLNGEMSGAGAGGKQYTGVNCVDDGKFKLEVEDDAATVNWGGDWRMPTATELKELFDGCVWVLTNNFNGSGVAGLVGTSKKNGNVIFLPEANGYWSSTLDVTRPSDALYIGNNKIYVPVSRFQGKYVRAVVK